MLDKAYANLECAGLLELSLKQVDALLFFFQAEDGILDIGVTGVQTCALPIFIPLQPHFLALHGLGKLLETTAVVKKRINPGLRVTGIVICLYDAATRLGQEV